MFTPGPWKVFDESEQVDSRYTYGIDSDNGYAVVFFGVSQCDGIRKLEDAKLIAAAPDLLEALKNLLRDEKLEDWEQDLVDSRLAAERVIAKAEGR